MQPKTAVIEIKVDPYVWTETGHAWWEVGMPEVSKRPEVLIEANAIDRGRARQRLGV